MIYKNSRCTVCRNKIISGAKKCIHCKSNQGWLSFFDVSFPTISFLIAILSLLAAITSNLTNLSSLVKDKNKAQFISRVISIEPYKITLFVANLGKGAAIFDGGVLCRMAVTDREDRLYTKGEETPEESFVNIRLPLPNEIKENFLYSYYPKEQLPIILNEGENKVVEMPLSEMRKEWRTEKGKIQNFKSYCSFFFVHQNGKKDVNFQDLSAFDVSLFSLDQPDVKNILSKFRNGRFIRGE